MQVQLNSLTVRIWGAVNQFRVNLAICRGWLPLESTRPSDGEYESEYKAQWPLQYND